MDLKNACFWAERRAFHPVRRLQWLVKESGSCLRSIQIFIRAKEEWKEEEEGGCLHSTLSK